MVTVEKGFIIWKRELYKIKEDGRIPLLEPKPGLEPGTYSLRMNCSTN